MSQLTATKHKGVLHIKKQKKHNLPSEFYLKPKEIKRLIGSARNQRDKTLIKLIAHTGMRRNEARLLEVRDIEYDRKQIHVRRGKFDKSRVVPVTSDLLSDLRNYIGYRETGYVFQGRGEKPISPRLVNNIVGDAGVRAGLDHPDPSHPSVINPHLLRHSLARNLLAKGMDLRYVQQILGHKSYKTTVDVYGVPSVAEVGSDYEDKMEDIY